MIDKGWTEAVEIEVRDRVLLQNGTTETVDEKVVEELESPIKVYNFTVDDFHTYFVGENGVLVHNANYNKATSQNQMQKQVEKGQAPKGIDRVDPAHNAKGQPHIHFSDDEYSLNIDGTWGHKNGSRRPPKITSRLKKWLKQNGWNLPTE